MIILEEGGGGGNAEGAVKHHPYWLPALTQALALLYPHRIGQPGFTPLTAGCGFALKGLYDKAHVCRRRRRTGARGRQPMEYWLPAPRGAGAFA